MLNKVRDVVKRIVVGASKEWCEIIRNRRFSFFVFPRSSLSPASDVSMRSLLGHAALVR